MINSEEELLKYLIKCNDEKDYENALKTIDKYEGLIQKKYYEIIRYKILFLIESKKYIDASILIKEELNVPYIPKDFEEFLREKQKEVRYFIKSNSSDVISFEDIKKIDQFNNDELFAIIPCLYQFNLYAICDKLQNVFDNKNISSTIKSILIASLSDYKLDHEFIVIKEGVTIKFNPKTVFDLRYSSNTIYIKNELKKYNDIEINILEIIKKLANRYLLYLYPLKVSEDYCNDIIVASFIMAYVMSNQQLKDDRIKRLFIEREQNVKKIMENMTNLLESI